MDFCRCVLDWKSVEYILFEFPTHDGSLYWTEGHLGEEEEEEEV